MCLKCSYAISMPGTQHEDFKCGYIGHITMDNRALLSMISPLHVIVGAEDSDLPEDWEPMTDPSSRKEVALRVVNLAATSEGYRFALAEFNKTMIQGTNYTSIVKIERIQNPALYRHYATKKKYLDTHNPKGVQNERWLFHGTQESSVHQINKTSFNRNFHGQNGMQIY